MNIWITGENGFISRAFSRHLVHKHTVENSHENENYNYWKQKRFLSKHFQEIDIFDPTLNTLIEKSEVDCIIHTATIISYDKPELMIRTNIEGSYIVADIAKKMNIPLIFISYKNHNNNLFKWSQDCILSMFKELDIKFINIITDELFGPEDFYGNLSQLIMSSTGNIDLANISTDIETSRSYTFIDDFLDGLDLILENINNYIRKNVSIMSSDFRSLEDVIDYMSNTMEIPIHYNIQETKNISIDFEDVYEVNGWSKKYQFENALEITRDLIYDRSRK